VGPPTSLYANPLSLDRGFVLYIIIYPNTFPREGVFACNEISIRDEFLGSIINVGVRKYSFLTPFLHKKVDIDGIHSYN